MIAALAWLLVVLLPLYGGFYLGIRRDREAIARIYKAIVESRRRQPYRRLRGR